MSSQRLGRQARTVGISFDFNAETLTLRETAAADATPEDFIENLAKFEAALPEGAALCCLADYREIQMDFSSAQISTMKQATNAMLIRRNASARTALVVSEPLYYGLARMYSMVEPTPAFEVAVFREMAEAEAWLGIDAIEPG